MFLSTVSVKRPYFSSMLNIVIIIFGLLAFANIGVDRDPDVAIPYVSASVTYKGMNPKTAEQLLLNPMEEAFKSLPGLKRIEGTAGQDYARVFLEFHLNVDIDKATADVRNAIGAIDLPKDAEKPSVFKLKNNARPFMIINISSDKMSEKDLSTYVNKELKPLLQRISGVGQVNISGTIDREIHINLNPSILNALHLNPNQIKKEINSQIVNKPSGVLRNSDSQFSIITNTIPSSLDTIAKIPIGQKDKPLIRVEDFATIQDTHAEVTNYSEVNGKKSIVIDIIKESKGNIVETAKQLKKLIENLNKTNKDQLHISINLDDSIYINETYKNVRFDIFLGSILAILVVYLFLHDWRNTFICSLAIPTSIIGTLAVINYLGFTLNSMTLLALTLAIGILVDDAIVVIENIHRHKVMGKSAVAAAIDGSQEIGLAAIAVTLAIAAVFVPVAYMEGIIGRYFYEFGMTVSVAVLISLFVAFTVVPMLSSKLGTKQSLLAKEMQWQIKFNHYFHIFQSNYQKILKYSLQKKKLTLLVGILIFILSIFLLKFVPKNFQSTEDESVSYFTFQLAQGTPLEEAIKRGKEIRDHIRSYSGTKDIIMNVGSNNDSASSISFTIKLVNPKNRTYSTTEFTQRLNESAKKFIRNPNEKIGGKGYNSAIYLDLYSTDSQALYEYSKKVLQHITKIKDIGIPESSVSDAAYEYKVTPDFIKAASLGVSPSNIAETLQLLYKGEKVGEFYAEGRYFNIKILIPIKKEQTLNSLAGIFIFSEKGDPVLLSSIASIEKVQIEPIINHINGITNVTISADYFGKDLGNIMTQINKYIAETKPKSVDTSYGGQAELLDQSSGMVSKALLLALAFIFIVLSAQFENFKAPLAILFSIPLSFSGAFLAILITGKSLTIDAMIGIILLLGLVTKNAILLIEFAQQKIAEGMDVDKALLESAVVRLRPILMTTLTMIAGMLPLIFGTGAGHEANSILGVTVTGGLISSTLLTLVVVPCVYSLLIKFKFPKRIPFMTK
ncbi:efflux RND transporter permease subunit [Pigmentibacter sp. JX0631]|uniref:efflux RND transporter permease subunit n=1 Tax=Pigmentibacter sp. JX0631 TaxID=2976982 RepID=UPI00246910AF|nr:efflux RND transporter permease subunit [Pigmentibacter sp. JX0631]WGL58497.1 efflux RND transporter permease subunit [Pigmentibacter sp. JX0631]